MYLIGKIYYVTGPKKIYRLKEDQAFWLSLELGRRDKVARHPSAEFLPPPPVPPFVYDRQSVGGGGQDFVDTTIAVKNVLERDER